MCSAHTSDSSERGPYLVDTVVGEYFDKLVVVVWLLFGLLIFTKIQLIPGIESCCI